MNLSQTNGTAGGSARRDSLLTALLKNLMVTCLCLLINYVNGVQIHTFRKHQELYEDPRYILFIHMVVNDAVQLSTTTALFVLSYTLYRIQVSVCCVFILLAVFTTRNTPLNLAAMALECYVAVCRPLRHAQICTARRTLLLIALIWLLCVTPDVTDLFFTLATEPLSFFHQSVFCLRSNIFKGPVLARKRTAFDVLYFCCVFLTLLFTYLKVLFAARALSTQRTSAQKARKTILLHGAQLFMCLLSYVSPSAEVLLQLIFPGQILEIRFANFLIVYVLPRCLSPIIYGFRDRKF
uniref:Odorant receptor, family 90, subfamily A, member 1 n=1 Tax=Tetraodon nigroviridis TaxID=99883 RepID=H3BWI6_TETNG